VPGSTGGRYRSASPPSGTKWAYTPKVLTEITASKETTPAHADGSSHLYAVRRDDGEEVAVEVRCAATVEATARATDNAYAVAVIENRGAGLALQLAERVQSPAQRGRVLIKVWFDPLDRVPSGTTSTTNDPSSSQPQRGPTR
jgi:hypothetical protein